jgi:iron(III) transport system permease protein
MTAAAERRTQISSTLRANRGHFLMAVIILALGAYLFAPIVWILIQTFNVSAHPLIGEAEWGLSNWSLAFGNPAIWSALGNSLAVWGLTLFFSFPIAVAIAWALGRTKVPMANTLEVLFWVSYIMPNISTTLAWITLLHPERGLLNKLVELLPFVDKGPFNVFSVPGIVWAHMMGNGISLKVMLLAPAFRNMDSALEEAGRVGGGSSLRVMLRITLPMIASPMVLIIALQMLRIFQSFETEWLLGVPFRFYVYSTLIYQLVRLESIPQYGQAAALASVTILVIGLIIPLQRWIIRRRIYTTVTAGFRPGLTDLGRGRWLVFGSIALLLFLLTVLPFSTLVLGSFMFRSGYFGLKDPFTLGHWKTILFENDLFIDAVQTTLALASVAAVASPLLFATLAYVLVRTDWKGRNALDVIIWTSSAIPGMLSGLGLLMVFLGTPGLNYLYGTLWALLLVVIIQGHTTGINISKGAIVQIGKDMEDAARVSGAGWFRTWWRIWLPLIMPTLVMLAVVNFTTAAGATSSIILLADRGTMTLSIMALELASGGMGEYEKASIISIILTVLTVGLGIAARRYGLALGVRQH